MNNTGLDGRMGKWLASKRETERESSELNYGERKHCNTATNSVTTAAGLE